MALEKQEGLFVWIVLIGLMLNVMLYIFTGFFPNNSFPQTIPSLSQVSQYEGNLTAAGHNIATAFNFNTFKYGSCRSGDWGCTIVNFGVFIGNIAWSIGGVIVNIAIIFGLGLAIIILILFGVIPQILGSFNLGIIADLLYLIDTAIVLIIGYYLYILLGELWAWLSHGR